MITPPESVRVKKSCPAKRVRARGAGCRAVSVPAVGPARQRATRPAAYAAPGPAHRGACHVSGGHPELVAAQPRQVARGFVGFRGSPQSELVFEDVEIPRENLIGVEGKGVGIMMSLAMILILYQVKTA